VSDKSEALAALKATRRDALDAVDGIPDERMSVPAFGTWAVKDVLCHLTSWEQAAVPDLHRIARGQVPQLATFRLEEIDDWNAWLMRSRNLFPLPQVIHELNDSRQQFVEALNALPDGLFATGQPVRMLVDSLIDGNRTHADEIRGWREREGI